MKFHLSLAAVLLAALPMISDAESFGPGPVSAAATSFRLGAVSVTSLSDSKFVVPNDGKIFGADVGAEAVARVLRSANAPTDVIALPVDALLVRDGARVALIDTGHGDRPGGALMASLQLAGLLPADVTDVLITHPHPDHIGGLLTVEGRSAFPKARISMSGPDWKDLQGQPDQKALVAAISSQVRAFEPGAAITPAITSVTLPGHTSGHVGYRISSGGESLLDVGDMVHSSIITLAEPGWTMAFDHDSPLAKSTRRQTLNELVQSGQLVFAPHFPYPGIGVVKASKEGFSWQPVQLPRGR